MRVSSTTTKKKLKKKKPNFITTSCDGEKKKSKTQRTQTKQEEKMIPLISLRSIHPFANTRRPARRDRHGCLTRIYEYHL